jgi:T5SS/PEP-CTERM-associated repeat protein
MSRQLWFCALILFAFTSQSVLAQTFDWSNTSGGSYSTGANWTPVGPPGAAATARFAIANTYNVTFINATAGILTISQGDITFFLNGFTYQTTNTVSNGMGATGLTSKLRITNGTFAPGNFSVGGNSGSNSTLTLDSDSTTNIGAGVFFVGTNGTGHLNVQNGADLTTTASTGLGINAPGVGSATVTGIGSTWTVNNTLRIGASGNGSLNVNNGGSAVVNALEVGENFNSTGALSVNGSGATFTTGGTANIGGAFASSPAASATLNVGPGATVNLNGITNLRTVAKLNITGGVLNLNTVNLTAGADANWSAGTVNFANGSSITAGMLDFLLDGTHVLGTNRILSAFTGSTNLTTPLAVNGGTLSVNQLVVSAGMSIGAFGTVAAADTLEIGSGQTVEIENFGKMAATSLAHNNGGALILKGSNAKVTAFFANNFGTVEGTGRFTAGMNNGTGGTIRAKTGDHLIIEQSGLTNPGIIELAGGTVEYQGILSNLGNGFIIGRGTFRGGSANPGGNGLSNLGVMAFSAGTTDIYGDVLNTGTGKIVAAGGSVVTFFDDVTHNGAEIRTNAGSRTVFFGDLTGAGPLTGAGVVEFNGDLRPGNSPALLTIGGDAEFSTTAALEIEIAGTVKGARYDSVDVAGDVFLNGDLNVSLIDGFSPLVGDTFEILTAGEILGSFDDINLPTLPGLLFWEVFANANSIALSVDAPIIPGDFNLDGTVNGLDLAQWQGDYHLNDESDADNDGDSDGRDFLVWQKHFGESIYGPLVAATSVPEPSSAVLFLFGAGLLTLRPHPKPLAA